MFRVIRFVVGIVLVVAGLSLGMMGASTPNDWYLYGGIGIMILGFGSLISSI